MALGGVFIQDTDGNIGIDPTVVQEKISGIIFDTSKQPDLFTAGYGKNNIGKLKLGDICYITSLKSAENDFGIIEYKKILWIKVIQNIFKDLMFQFI